MVLQVDDSEESIPQEDPESSQLSEKLDKKYVSENSDITIDFLWTWGIILSSICPVEKP